MNGALIPRCQPLGIAKNYSEALIFLLLFLLIRIALSISPY